MMRILSFIVLVLVLGWACLTAAPIVVNGPKVFPAAGGGAAPAQVYVNSARGTSLVEGTAVSLTIGATLSNGYIFVDWAIFDNAAETIATCSFDGTAMTSLASYALVGDTNNRIQQFGLAVASKAAASYNVTFTISGGGANITEYAIGVRAFNNVHQTTSTGTAATASSSTAQTSSSVTVTSTTGELIVDTLLQGSGLVSTASGAGHTERWDQGGAAHTTGAGGDIAGAASVACTWTFSSQSWAAVGIPLKPAP